MLKAILSIGVATGAILVATSSTAQTATSVVPSAEATTQDLAGDIVVTANRREERLQDVPIAVSALSGEQIRNQRITNALDLNNVTPGLRISAADAAANPKIFIRGVGLSDFNPSSSSGVGIYVDGVYVGSPLAQLAGFYDISRIEVLRGPQGTLFGRNTTGGAINIITNRPTNTFTGDASIDYGEYNTVNANAGIGGPLIADTLAFRVSGQYIRDDGTSRNRTTGNRIGWQDRYAVRGQLLFTPASNVEFLAQSSFFRTRGSAVVIKQRPLFPTEGTPEGPDGLCLGNYNGGGCTDLLGYADKSKNPYSVESNLEGEDKVDVATANLTATIGLGGIDLIVVTAYQDAWRDDVENTDASPMRLIEARYRTVQREFSQEVRFQSHGKTRTRWVAGGYYMRDYLRDNSQYDILRDIRSLFVTAENPSGVSVENSVGLFNWPYTQKTDSYAVFGQLDYDLTDRLTLTGGLRWSADAKRIDYISQVDGGDIVLLREQANKTFSDWSGRAGIAYELSPVARAYATFNRGYKSGGFFGGQATDAAQLEPYRNETLNAYEVGFKSELLDRRIRANLSAFYYDYADQQVFSQELRNGVTTQVLTNAGASRAYGGEIEIAGNPVRPLSINLSASYLNTKILEFISAGQNYSGNALQHSPKWTLSGTVNYVADLPGGSAIVMNANANWRTRIYFDNTQRLRVSESGKTVVDGQVGWRLPDARTEVGIFAKNLFNETYLLGMSPIDSLGIDGLTYAPPRRAGIYARTRF